LALTFLTEVNLTDEAIYQNAQTIEICRRLEIKNHINPNGITDIEQGGVGPVSNPDEIDIVDSDSDVAAPPRANPDEIDVEVSDDE
jgi:hypothetical protein